METLKRDHVFDRYPPGFNVSMGIPVYMACECGRRWYTDKPKPKSSCPQRRVMP